MKRNIIICLLLLITQTCEKKDLSKHETTQHATLASDSTCHKAQMNSIQKWEISEVVGQSFELANDSEYEDIMFYSNGNASHTFGIRNERLAGIGCKWQIDSIGILELIGHDTVKLAKIFVHHDTIVTCRGDIKRIYLRKQIER